MPRLFDRDSMAMAFKAGAELKNLEFATLWIQPANYIWEAIGTTLPMGAQIVNAKGEPFIEKYSPKLKSKIDFSFLARAMAIEAKRGNGPFFLDHSTVKPEDLAFLKKRAGWMEINIEKLKKVGVEPFDEKQEWMPVFWTVQGIKADLDCRTKVPGLFVGGRVRSIDPGVTMGSWSIASATVLGYRTSENAPDWLRGISHWGSMRLKLIWPKQNFMLPLAKSKWTLKHSFSEFRKFFLIRTFSFLRMKKFSRQR